jgi:hypothetical protein
MPVLKRPACTSSGSSASGINSEMAGASQLGWERGAPFGVSSTMSGGFMGYSGGIRIRPWNLPPSKGVSGGPAMVKCHSNSSSYAPQVTSAGWAQPGMRPRRPERARVGR